MERVSEARQAAILKKTEILAGQSLGENGAAVVEMACEAACAWCCREDIPEEMEQAVAQLAAELAGGQAGAVKAVQRGDTAVTYAVDAGGFGASAARLAPFRRLGSVRKG